MLNIVPHSSKQFDTEKHFLRQDVIFAPPGAYLILKWCKTMQDNKSHHILQIPEIDNIWLCPVRALKALLSSRPLHSVAPLFANKVPPYSQIIDTHIRDALKTVLSSLRISPIGHGFHTFRRSGATLAFNNNVSLAHGHMGYGEAQQYGPTCRIHHRPPPSSLPLLLLLSPHAFDWAW